MTRPERPVRGAVVRALRVDWLLVTAAVAVSLIGALLVFSATYRASGSTAFLRQLAFVALGVAAAVGVAAVPRRQLRATVPWVYLAALGGLLVVLTPGGSTINGARSWIVLGPLSVQPAEFAKIGLIVMTALVLTTSSRSGVPAARSVLGVLVLTAVPMLLVLAQPDLGSTVVLGVMTVTTLVATGARARWIWGLVGSATAAVVVALTTPVLGTYQRDRLLAFADPTLDPQGIGYQTRQVRIAIGSGGWFGQGLFHGGQTQAGFVPFDQTDFVFSVAGEELGFAGALLVVALLAVVCWRGLAAARATTSAFDRAIAVGVVAWFGLQGFENIGMNLGLVPVTGLPLPFVSYGGSSMLATWIGVGLLLGVAVRLTPSVALPAEPGPPRR